MSETLELELGAATVAALEQEAERLDMSTAEYAALLLRERSVVADDGNEDSPRSLRLGAIEERLAKLEAQVDDESLPSPDELAKVAESAAGTETPGDSEPPAADAETPAAGGQADADGDGETADGTVEDDESEEESINIDRLLDLYKGGDGEQAEGEDEDDQWARANAEEETVELGSPDGADDDDVANAIGQIDRELEGETEDEAEDDEE